MSHYFVRIGALGEIVVASALIPLRPGRRVVVRSSRGTEIAEVTAPCGSPFEASAYRIVRPTTDSDERLAERLHRYKRDAIEACRKRLSTEGCAATLLDVDQLLDGGTLKLHFLGELDAAAQRIADDIASEYESIVRSDQLAKRMSEGCGPQCGSGAGCSTNACSGCSGCG